MWNYATVSALSREVFGCYSVVYRSVAIHQSSAICQEAGRYSESLHTVTVNNWSRNNTLKRSWREPGNREKEKPIAMSKWHWLMWKWIWVQPLNKELKTKKYSCYETRLVWEELDQESSWQRIWIFRWTVILSEKSNNKSFKGNTLYLVVRNIKKGFCIVFRIIGLWV